MTFEIRILRSREEKCFLYNQNLDDVMSFFDSDLVMHRTYIVALEKGNVVGLVCMREEGMWVPNALHIGYVETHPAHRNKGIATKLVEQLFLFASAEKKAISNTKYEPQGQLWLQPVMQAAAIRHPAVALHER